MKKSNILIRAIAMCSVMLLVTVAACRSQQRDADITVRSHLQGRVTVSAEIDTTENYSGFEVIVGREGVDGLDTLAFAVTDAGGFFETDVDAPGRGIYPLLI